MKTFNLSGEVGIMLSTFSGSERYDKGAKTDQNSFGGVC